MLHEREYFASFAIYRCIMFLTVCWKRSGHRYATSRAHCISPGAIDHVDETKHTEKMFIFQFGI